MANKNHVWIQIKNVARYGLENNKENTGKQLD